MYHAFIKPFFFPANPSIESYALTVTRNVSYFALMHSSEFGMYARGTDDRFESDKSEL